MHLTRLLLVTPVLLLVMSVGCGPSKPEQTASGPDRAANLKMVSKGTNTELKFKADQPGQIIVSNFNAGDTLYKGTLKKGDTFTLIPDSSRAMINKDFVGLDHDTNIHDEYRLYFLPQ